MRVALLLLLSLLLGGCSCSRKPEPEAEVGTAALAAPPSPDPAALAQASAREALHEQQRRNASAAAGTLHRYLGALASGELATADALWVGGKPPPAPDDAGLRAMGGYSAHINTDAPRPLETDPFPSRVFEIPVRLGLSDAQGQVRHWSGWYRLRRKIGNDGWEISTASMQPQLD